MRGLSFLLVIGILSEFSNGRVLKGFHDPFRFDHQFGQKLSMRDEAANVSSENFLIYGSDMLGWGVDIRKAVPENSLYVKCFEFDYNEGNNYTYPLEPEVTYRVPDEVFVRTVTELESESEVFERGKDFLTNLRIRMGLSLQGSSTAEVYDSPDAEQEGEDRLSSFPFQGDVSVNYQWNQLETNQMIITTSSLQCGLYQLALGPSVRLTSYMRETIRQTAINAAADGPAEYARFFERHGTHYVEGAVVGGYLEVTSTVEKDRFLDTNELLVLANFEFKKMFGLDSGNVNLEIQYNDRLEEYEENVSNWMRVLGGDPQLADFFTGNKNAPKTFQEWYRSLMVNPVVIRYRLREISWLFGVYRKQAHDALKSYLSGDLSAFTEV